MSDVAAVEETVTEKARKAAEEAWHNAAMRVPYEPLDIDDILNVVLSAVEPVYREGFLKDAEDALEKWANTMEPSSDYKEGRRDAAFMSTAVVARLRTKP